jgi:hypothetical protein
LGDAPAELMEAVFETCEEYGVDITAGEQVAVVRAITAGPTTGKAIEAAFAAAGLRRPPAGFGSEVLRRWGRFGEPKSLLDVVLDYRQFAIGNLSRQYGGNTRGHEEELRNSLHTYLPQHGFKEAQSGRGNTDVVIPDRGGGQNPDAIIETKVWKGSSDYEDGLAELETYIHNDRPRRAIYVVFCDESPLPAVITDKSQAIAERRVLAGIEVPVVIVPFEKIAPSKVRQTRRKESGRP